MCVRVCVCARGVFVCCVCGVCVCSVWVCGVCKCVCAVCLACGLCVCVCVLCVWRVVCVCVCVSAVKCAQGELLLLVPLLCKYAAHSFIFPAENVCKLDITHHDRQ